MVIREQQNLAAPCGLYYCRSCRSYIGQRALAVALRINDIVHGTRAISPDTALRLPRYFGLSEGFCMIRQSRRTDSKRMLVALGTDCLSL